MLQTYSAVLRGGRIEWGPGGPPVLPPDASIPVHITLLAPHPVHPTSGPAMVAALEAIAATGGPSGFGDPCEWQRETRADRPLPGRAE